MGLREWAYVALAALIVSAGGYAYHVVRKAGYDEAKAECIAASITQRAREAKQSNVAGKSLEDDREKTRTVYRTITQSVNVYVDRPVYRADCFDADGLRDANAALRGESPTRLEPDRPVPPARTDGGLEGGHRAAQADRGESGVLRLPGEAPPPRGSGVALALP